MDLQSMRASFKRRAHGLADSLSNGDIDGYLNRAYQHTVPDQVPGMLTESTWDLTTVALTSTYAFPSYVHSVRYGIRIGNEFLDLHDREPDFRAQYDPDSTQTGEPQAVLNYGRSLEFWPNPDAEYSVVIPVRTYPKSGTALAEISTSGIEWNTHAQAVLWHGLIEFSEDYDLVELEERAQMKAAAFVGLMVGRELSRIHRRRPRRTF